MIHVMFRSVVLHLGDVTSQNPLDKAIADNVISPEWQRANGTYLRGLF